MHKTGPSSKFLDAAVAGMSHQLMSEHQTGGYVRSVSHKFGRVTAKRGGVSRQVEIEKLTGDELRDLLKRATPSQVLHTPSFSPHGYGTVQSDSGKCRRSSNRTRGPGRSCAETASVHKSNKASTRQGLAAPRLPIGTGHRSACRAT